MYVSTLRKQLLSVGIDIGSSTSHVVFSRIVLEKDPNSRTEKFHITERKVIHSGPIHFTPFLDAQTIDFVKLKELLLNDYAVAGFKKSDIDTGAVIITGETAKKTNAEEIVNDLAGEVGKFVAASAGPNFEAVLAAHGSGTVERSSALDQVIMNIDVGGGSSNIAVCKGGRIINTAAINVGGRLVAFDSTDRVVQLELTGKRLAHMLGLDIEVDSVITENTKEILAESLADALLEAMEGKADSELTKKLMMTPKLDITEHIDAYTFSGGVAEYIYGTETANFLDLGKILGEKIREKTKERGFIVELPEQKIRATVIGAGQFNLQVSGSTTFLSAGLEYPLRNLPVVVPHITHPNASPEHIASAITTALQRFDLDEGNDRMILAFKDSVKPSYERLTQFSKGVVAGLPGTVQSGNPILLCFDSDIGNSVGNVMKRETGISNDILSIDEVELEEGDFVDIGEPIIENVVVPVVVKTLVFEKNDTK